MKELVDEHKSTFDENHLRDFIDVYLKEMQSGQDPDFNGNKYILKHIQLFIATNWDILFVWITFFRNDMRASSKTVILKIQTFGGPPELLGDQRTALLDKISGKNLHLSYQGQVRLRKQENT